MRVTNKRAKGLWQVKWQRAPHGEEVPAQDWLWIIARNATSAASKAGKFLRVKNRRAQVTAVIDEGEIDVF